MRGVAGIALAGSSAAGARHPHSMLMAAATPAVASLPMILRCCIMRSDVAGRCARAGSSRLTRGNELTSIRCRAMLRRRPIRRIGSAAGGESPWRVLAPGFPISSSAPTALVTREAPARRDGDAPPVATRVRRHDLRCRRTTDIQDARRGVNACPAWPEAFKSVSRSKRLDGVANAARRVVGRRAVAP